MAAIKKWADAKAGGEKAPTARTLANGFNKEFDAIRSTFNTYDSPKGDVDQKIKVMKDLLEKSRSLEIRVRRAGDQFRSRALQDLQGAILTRSQLISGVIAAAEELKKKHAEEKSGEVGGIHKSGFGDGLTGAREGSQKTFGF